MCRHVLEAIKVLRPVVEAKDNKFARQATSADDGVIERESLKKPKMRSNQVAPPMSKDLDEIRSD